LAICGEALAAILPSRYQARSQQEEATMRKRDKNDDLPCFRAHIQAA
jgi:hypothetical protein